MPKTVTPTKKPTPTQTTKSAPKTKGDNEHSPIGPNTILKLTIKWSEIEPVYQKVIRKFAAGTKLPGFRQGKAPTPLVVEQVGMPKILDATLDRVLPPAYSELIKKENKQPITQPDIHPEKIEIGKDWELRVEIAEQPAVDVTGYQKIVAKAKKEAVSGWKKYQEEHKKADEAAKNDPAHAGHDHHHEHTPEADAQAEKDFTLKQIYQSLILELHPAIPELLVKVEARRELDELVQSLERFKLSLDDYLARRQISFEDLSGEVATNVLAKWQLEFVVQAIVEAASLKASQPEITKYIEQSGNPELSKVADKPEYQNYLQSLTTREKLIAHFESLK